MAYNYQRTTWIDTNEEASIEGTQVTSNVLNNIESAIVDLGNTVVTLDKKRSTFLNELGDIKELNNSNPQDIVASARESMDLIDSLKTEKQADMSVDFDKFHHIYKTKLSELKNVIIKGDTRINYLTDSSIKMNYFLREGYSIKPDISSGDNYLFTNIPNTSVLENVDFSIGQKFMESYLYPSNEYYLSFILLTSEDTDIDVEVAIASVVESQIIKLKSGYYNVRLKAHDEITSEKDLKSEIKLYIKAPISGMQILLLNPKLNRIDGTDETFSTGINSVKNINIVSNNSNLIDKNKTLPTILVNNTPFFTPNTELIDINNDITVNSNIINYGCGWFVNVEPDTSYEIEINLSQLPYYKMIDLNILSSNRDLYTDKIYELTKDNILWSPSLLMNEDAVVELNNLTNKYGDQLYYSKDWDNNAFNIGQNINNFYNIASSNIKLENLFAEDNYTYTDKVFYSQLYYESYENVKYIKAKIHTGVNNKFIIISLNAVTDRQNYIEDDKFIIEDINLKNIEIESKEEHDSYILNIDLKGEELNRINDKIYDSIELYGGKNVLLKHTNRGFIKSSFDWKIENSDEENNKLLFSARRPFNKEEVLSFNYNECIFVKRSIRDIYYNKLEDKIYIEVNKTHVIYDLETFVNSLGDGFEIIYPINEKVIDLDIDNLNIDAFPDVTNICTDFGINGSELAPYISGTVQLASENMMKDISNRLYKLNNKYSNALELINSIKLMNKEIFNKMQICNNLIEGRK